jgi:hypothetical protein
MADDTRITILDPIGPARIVRFDLSPRLRSGPVRVAILENSKPNADHLLRSVADGIVDHVGGSVVRHLTKSSPASPAPAAWYRQIAEEADLVLTGSGD